MRTMIMMAAVLLATGCRAGKDALDDGDLDSDGLSGAADEDGDGYDADEDCDDNNSLVNPGAVELCDGFDNDCDGTVDEGVATTFYADGDGDGFGDPADSVEACEQPDGHVPIGNDCDDTDDTSYPGAAERCDGVDNDCDGAVDEDVTTTFYADTDGDSYGDPAASVEDCDPGDGYVADDTDCDDSADTTHPGAAEVCDEADNDCDGTVDEDVTTTYYQDTDGDTYGDPGATTEACSLPTGYAASAGDCDDSDAAVSPAASEVCNSIDDDCDGTIDGPSATDAETFYADTDSDGYGDPSSTTRECTAPSGYVSDDADCDDSSASVSPAAAEVCNGIDDDCDGDIDDDDASVTGTSTFYADDDADSYGDASDSTTACAAPSGYVSDDTDCDDSDAAVSPAGTEVCNEVDDDCDGDTDEGVQTTYYADDDSDGYGDADADTEACSVPSGYTDDDSDCDDTDTDVNPAASEVCNEVDDDCDGDIDEDAASPETFYADDDADGYGDADDTTQACSAPSGYVDDDADCDDSDADVNPAAAEVCNGADDDCDGSEDEGVLGTGEDCAADSCLDILTDDSSAADGDYWVYFDSSAEEATCDMTTDGGGWTLIFDDDFESTPDSGWSLSSTYSCGSWSSLLGGYGIIAGGEIDITVSTYAISHTEAWVELEYMALDSWDGEDAYVEVDGSTVWSKAQNNHSTSYSEVCGWDRGYEGSYDSKHDLSEIVSHTASSIELIAGSDLDQANTDESFGIDDVFIWVR